LDSETVGDLVFVNIDAAAPLKRIFHERIPVSFSSSPGPRKEETFVGVHPAKPEQQGGVPNGEDQIPKRGSPPV
jgi:hypothetical protein